MKKIIALLMSGVLLLTGCAANGTASNNPSSVENEVSTADDVNDKVVDETQAVEDEKVDDDLIHVVVGDDDKPDDTEYVYTPEFSSLNDKQLETYVEDALYKELVSSLDSDKYYVENVSAVYISQEYIDEITYNSQSNVYFGYTLEEIDAQFQGTRYVFTLGKDGDTVVRPFEEYDDTYEQIIKNVAIGTGVILVCVTVSVVTAGAGAPAVSLIFATAAKTGTIMALSSATLGGVSAGVVTGIETGDMSQVVKAAELAASDGYKWGAITGVITGGVGESVNYANAMKALKGVTLNITTQEAAAIQMQTGYPAEIISQFHSMEEFKVFQDAGLKAQMINGELALVRKDIDLYNIVDEMGRNNLTRMQKGLSPIGIDDAGNVFKYELHHIGQEADATLAILTTAEHDNAVLHGFKAVSEIDREAFDVVRKHFWKTMARFLTEGAV